MEASKIEPLESVCEQFLEQIKNPRTRDTYRWALRALQKFLGNGEQLTTEALEGFYDWLVDQEYSPHTVQTYVATVRRLIKWMDAHQQLPPGFQFTRAFSLLSMIRGNRQTAPYKHRWPDPDLPRIVTYYDDLPLVEGDNWQARKDRLLLLRNRAIVHTLYASGGRVSEIAQLTREAVMDGRLDEAHIVGKGGYERIILLTPEAMGAIKAYTKERDKEPDDRGNGLFVSHGRDKGNPLGRGTIWKVVKDAAKALDLHKSTSPHSFRHYRATQLLNEGMPLESVQMYLGHQDIGTTRKVYAHTRTAVLKDQFQRYGISARDVVTESE